MLSALLLLPSALCPLPFALSVQYNSLLNVRLERHPQPPPHRLSDEGEPAVRRAGDARAMEGDGPVRQDSRAPERRAEVRPARRTAVCQRSHPHGHGAQQDSEGCRRQVAVDGRLRCAVRRGLRLPRPADRAEGRQGAGAQEARHERGRILPRVPRVRRAVRRHHDRAIPAAWHSRHLGSAVPDDGFPLSGGHRAHVRAFRREGAGLQRQEAGALVHPLPNGACRSGSRIPAAHVAVDLRRVPACARKRGRAGVARPGARGTRRVGVDLDDDALDDSVESRGRVSPGVRLRRVRRRRPRRHRGGGAGAEGRRRRPDGASTTSSPG